MDKRLLDSNIIIYANQSGYANLRNYISQYSLFASRISVLETLGYHSIHPQEKADLEAFFETIFLLDLDDTIIQQAVGLKQSQKMTLGDSIIAATSLIYQIPILTRNVVDFKNISGLVVINPFDFI